MENFSKDDLIEIKKFAYSGNKNGRLILGACYACGSEFLKQDIGLAKYWVSLSKHKLHKELLKEIEEIESLINDESSLPEIIDLKKSIVGVKIMKPYMEMTLNDELVLDFSPEKFEELLYRSLQEDADAQYELSCYFFDTKQYDEAISYLSKSGFKGKNISALKKLGEIYFSGEIVRRDYKISRKAFSLACELGCETSCSWLPTIDQTLENREKKAKESSYLQLDDNLNEFKHAKGFGKLFSGGKLLAKGLINVGIGAAKLATNEIESSGNRVLRNENATEEQKQRAREMLEKNQTLKQKLNK